MNIDQLKQLRQRLGMTQAEVASAAGISRFVLSLAENKHIELRREEQLAVVAFLAAELEAVKALSVPDEVAQ